MAGFSYETEEIRFAHLALVDATDGSEPCYDAHLTDHKQFHYESPTDLFVESWSQRRGVSKAQAEALCAPCHIQEQCAAYAMLAKEPLGIWGGTRPVDRGIAPRWKG